MTLSAHDRDLPFRELVEAFEKLDATTSGNEMVAILADLFRRTPHGVIHLVSYFVQGNLAAEYEDVNLQIGERLMAEALARASGRPREEIEKLYDEKGDYGLVAEAVLEGQAGSGDALTVRSVHEKLLEIARQVGTGSQEAKLNLLAELLKQATPREARYLVRIALGTLRLGAGTMTILNALAVAFTGEKKNKARLEKAYNLCGDVGLVAQKVAEKGLNGLDEIKIQVGHPIKMMAAQRVQTLHEIFEKMPHGFAVEWKYDGERVQCHKKGDQVTIFSRNLENITHQYPDVVEAIRRDIQAEEAIVEGEVVALVPGTDDQFQPFQVLMSRRRKYDIERYVKEIPVKLFLFDVLYADGESAMEKSYPERRALLERIVKPSESGRVDLTARLVSSDPEEIENFFDEAVERGLEGIMAKSCAPDSVYRAGAREWSWIKWKRDYSQELADTFDVVAVGGFAGRGKRSGTWGALLCAVYNPECDRFETLCKVSTGFSDEELAKLPEMFKPYETDHKPARVISKLEPTRWFEPALVLEISGAELTRSPIHTCGAPSEDEPGIALRFPRFLRFRDDKSAEEATTVAEVKQLFERARSGSR